MLLSLLLLIPLIGIFLISSSISFSHESNLVKNLFYKKIYKLLVI